MRPTMELCPGSPLGPTKLTISIEVPATKPDAFGPPTGSKPLRMFGGLIATCDPKFGAKVKSKACASVGLPAEGPLVRTAENLTPTLS